MITIHSPSSQGPTVSYADLVVDQSTGIIVQPLSLLSSDSGVHSLSTRVTALSLQYEKLWVLLHAEAENRCSTSVWEYQ